MTKKDFKNKKITIMGLGLHGGGVGSARFFAQAGAKVLVTDIKSEDELRPSLVKLKDLNIKYALGQHRPEDFRNTDMIIKNPGVPQSSKYLAMARENKVPIYTDIEIFLNLCKAPIIAITGTKGKSTTASLIYTILKKEYENIILAGNIRISVLSKLKNIKKNYLIILELSSSQLEDLGKTEIHPHTTIITNIFPDHIDRHKTLENYVKAKSKIFKNQDKGDFLILNYDNKLTRKLFKQAKARIRFFSLKVEKIKGAHVLGKNIVWGRDKEFICPKSAVNLLGRHNLYNALAAITCAKIYKIKNKNIKKALKSFKSLDGRLEFIREINKVKYYNDTCATQPDAVIAALKSFKQPIVLIAGGSNKDLDFIGLAQRLTKGVRLLILLPGDGSDKIRRLLQKQEVKIMQVENMKQAVLVAHQSSEPGDIVLLSPGCASFSRFKHEFDRGRKFEKSVERL